ATLAAQSGLTTAARVAGAFGFRGPLLSVDGGSASSLAALQIATESLLLGEVDVALAGGVASHLLPEYYLALAKRGLLSTRGAPPFDERADGMVPGEG